MTVPDPAEVTNEMVESALAAFTDRCGSEEMWNPETPDDREEVFWFVPDEIKWPLGCALTAALAVSPLRREVQEVREENERLRQIVAADTQGLQFSIYVDSQQRWADMDIESETMALAEEAFEAFAAVIRAVVKRRHGTRGTYDEWTDHLRKEVSQVGAVLFNIAAIEGFDLIGAVLDEHLRWVKTDTNHDPVAALSDSHKGEGT
jgi:hypothetical protein